MAIVSVIIPIYNIESYLDKCIQSVLKQTYKDIEVILVDDGSPDACGAICEQYAQKDHRIKVIHKINGGLSDARNAGMLLATGKYLLFVDGDDSISEQLIEKTVRCAEEKQVDIVIFDYKSIEEDTEREDIWMMDMVRDKVLNSELVPEILITTPGAWNKLYRRDLWMSTGLQYPVGRTFEDLSTTPKLLLKARSIVYLNSEPLYYYMLREGSIMRSHDYEKSYFYRTAAIDDVIQYFKNQGKYEKYQEELEYITFEHGYFVPSKEIVLEDSKNPYLNRFRGYAYNLFPQLGNNKYIQVKLSNKDKILLALLKKKQYAIMTLLSKGRKLVDIYKKNK